MRRTNGAPWFDPGPIVELDPAKIHPNGVGTDEDRFFLALSLAFNDLKSINWVLDLIKDEAGDRSTATAEDGEANGVTLTLIRYAAGTLSEALTLLEENRAFITGPAFERYSRRLKGEMGDNWRALFAHASGQSPESKMLKRIRANGAFHYYQPKVLAAGFRWHFFEREQDEFNRRALASAGRSTFSTRFFFADGAAGGLVKVDADACGIDDGYKAIGDFARLAHKGLAAVLFAYLRERNGGPFPGYTKPAPPKEPPRWRSSSRKRRKRT